MCICGGRLNNEFISVFYRYFNIKKVLINLRPDILYDIDMFLLEFLYDELKSLIRGFFRLRSMNRDQIGDMLRRIFTGIPSRNVCEITPEIFIGGQFYRQAVPVLKSWGITAVISLRNKEPAKFNSTF